MTKNLNSVRKNISLLDHALSDQSFSLIARAQSRDWLYERRLPNSLSGFNPLHSAAFYSSESQLSEWLKKPEKSPRLFNESNFMIRELMFALHDYLHCWAYLLINELQPKLGFGTKKITKKNSEDFVFCHLLTEAVATVGLDYWYLSTLDLNAKLDLGSSFGTLTVSYHDRHKQEYARFNPNLDVQNKQFFAEIVNFYCSGELEGFALRDLKRSSLLTDWLKHEISYGEWQRVYSRWWIAYLSQGEVPLTDLDKSQKPIAVREKWQKELIHLIGNFLWDKVKNDIRIPLNYRFDPAEIWQNRSKNYDFRFVNLHALEGNQDLSSFNWGLHPEINFEYFFNQYVSQFSARSFDPELIKLFPYLIEKRDFKLVTHLFRDQKRIAGSNRKEPFNLFFLG